MLYIIPTVAAAVDRELLLVVVIIPHTAMAAAAVALWRCRSYLLMIIGGVGHIRTTTEAPPPA